MFRIVAKYKSQKDHNKIILQNKRLKIVPRNITRRIYSVLNFKLQVGQNQETDSPCSLKIIPKHLGHCPISSSINFLNVLPIQVFQKYKKQNEVNGKLKRMLSASTLFRLISLLSTMTVPR